MRRNRQQRLADEYERERAVDVVQIPFEKLEELLAALVLVDSADVDREPVADVVFLPKSLRRRVSGTSDPTPTTTEGTSRLPETVWIIACSSGELYMSARTPRNSG